MLDIKYKKKKSKKKVKAKNYKNRRGDTVHHGSSLNKINIRIMSPTQTSSTPAIHPDAYTLAEQTRLHLGAVQALVLENHKPEPSMPPRPIATRVPTILSGNVRVDGRNPFHNQVSPHEILSPSYPPTPQTPLSSRNSTVMGSTPISPQSNQSSLVNAFQGWNLNSPMSARSIGLHAIEGAMRRDHLRHMANDILQQNRRENAPAPVVVQPSTPQGRRRFYHPLRQQTAGLIEGTEAYNRIHNHRRDTGGSPLTEMSPTRRWVNTYGRPEY